MPPWMILAANCALYVVVGRWLTGRNATGRDAAFALWNLAAVYLFFLSDQGLQGALLLAAYVAVVSCQYAALCRWGERPGWLPWLAFLTPIAVLVIVRYAPVAANILRLSRPPKFVIRLVGMDFVGLSYLAFRTSYLVLEVRNGVVPRPTYWQYLGFAFFAPTLSIGPISPYAEHRRAFAGGDRPQIPPGRALLRVLVGAVKYQFLGPILNTLTYSGLLLDGHPHLWIDLPIAAVAFYLYLYCNFSGFCDIAIGGAGLMNIPVVENFDNPFAARNMREFWNRWHITLSHYMRDVVFSPVSKALVRLLGPANANHAIALTILLVFLLVGIWHGVGWNWVIFGAFHAVGVAGSHYYAVALRNWLGKARVAEYDRNRFIRALAVVLTQAYVTISLFFFANDRSAMHEIVRALRWY